MNKEHQELKQGSRLELSPEINHLWVGTGWNRDSQCVDFAAFLLKNGKIQTGKDIIFCGHRDENGISLDNKYPVGCGFDDDEIMEIELSKLNSDITEIVFALVIYNAQECKLTLGDLQNPYISLRDLDTKQELGRFHLHTTSPDSTSVLLSKLIRNGSGWSYEIIGEESRMDMQHLAGKFLA
nr:TerD family protein [uncultured Blautia sp.]